MLLMCGAHLAFFNPKTVQVKSTTFFPFCTWEYLKTILAVNEMWLCHMAIIFISYWQYEVGICIRML